MADDSLRYDETTALVVVDVQNDFADPQGSLYVKGGECIIGEINSEVAAARAGGATVVLTQDWHPPRTSHFIDDGGSWPVHCVRDTWGAELHPDLAREADLVLRKGTGGEDGYSAFTLVDPDSAATTQTGLGGYLAQRGIRKVVTVGLAADVCVKATALDAVGAGLESVVLWDLTRAVDLAPDDGERAAVQLAEAGVALVGAPE